MNEALRKLLEARGLSKEATEDQAWEFYFKESRSAAPQAPAEPPAPAADVDEMRKIEMRKKEAAAKEERGRIDGIRRAADEFSRMGYELSDLEDKCILEGTPVEEAYRMFSARCASSARSDAGLKFSGSIVVTKEERDKVREVAVDALTHRGGIRQPDEKLQGNEFVRMSIGELAERELRLCNQPVPSSREKIIERAMSSSDLPYILAATSNKFLFTGWEEAPTTYQIWCAEGGIGDYKAATFPRPSAIPDLVEANPNNGEYQYAAFGDAVETTTLKHWGRLLAVTLKALVNDDLGVFTSTPRRLGEAARRTVDKYVYATVLQGTAGAGETMGDSNALFDASNHLNYKGSGSGGAVSMTTLDALAVLMENQMDADGTAYVGDAPRFLLANAYYRTAVTNMLVVTNPTALGSTSTPVYNPWPNITPVFSPHITINTKKWWAIAGPKGKTVTVYGLGGPPRPVVDERAEFTAASWTFKVTMDFIAKADDWRYLAANYGS